MPIGKWNDDLIYLTVGKGMQMTSKQLKIKIFTSHITQYQIAEKLGIDRTKLCRMLQTELSEPEVEKIHGALKELESEHKQDRL